MPTETSPTEDQPVTTASLLFGLTAYGTDEANAHSKLLELEPDIRNKHLAVLFSSPLVWDTDREGSLQALRRIAQFHFGKRGIQVPSAETIRVHELWRGAGEVVMAMVAD